MGVEAMVILTKVGCSRDVFGTPRKRTREY